MYTMYKCNFFFFYISKLNVKYQLKCKELILSFLDWNFLLLVERQSNFANVVSCQPKCTINSVFFFFFISSLFAATFALSFSTDLISLTKWKIAWLVSQSVSCQSSSELASSSFCCCCWHSFVLQCHLLLAQLTPVTGEMQSESVCNSNAAAAIVL